MEMFLSRFLSLRKCNCVGSMSECASFKCCLLSGQGKFVIMMGTTQLEQAVK